MSDINRTSNTNTSTHHTDDPLAELARIVSGDTLDDRSHSGAGDSAEPGNDDFGLDMETELLRELDGNTQPIIPMNEQSFENQLLNELDLGEDKSQVEVKPEDDTGLEKQLHADLQAADAAVSGEPFIPNNTTQEQPPENISEQEQVHQAVEQPYTETVPIEQTPIEEALIDEPQIDEAKEDLDFDALAQTLTKSDNDKQPTTPNLELPVEAPQPDNTALGEAENNELDDIFAQGFAEELAEENLMPEQEIPQVEDLGEVFAQSISDIEQNEQVKDANTTSDPLTDLAHDNPIANLQSQFEDTHHESASTTPFGAPNNISQSNVVQNNEAQNEPQYDLDQMFSQEADIGSTQPQFNPLNDQVDKQVNAPDPAFDAAFADPGSLAAEDMEHSAQNSVPNNSNRGGGLKLALGALGVALIAGVGIVAWGAFSDGNVSNDENVPVIEAQTTPTKVKPQDPGGKKIANTENKVYENVTGNGTVATTQNKLINSRQEPTNLEANSGEQKNISRLKPTSQNAANNALGGVSPKRVRTLTIKPDGSIVRSEPVKTELAVTKPVAKTVAKTVANTVAKSVAKPLVTTAPQNTVQAKPIVKQAAKKVAKSAVAKPVAKSLAKVASQRPTASAPTSLTNTRSTPAARTLINKPTTIAINTVAPATSQASLPKGGYTVQVSSQRSDKAARASYANIKKRFSSVLGNRQPVIQKAVVKGKGTFYRAKIATRTKAEATKLCASLKRAGGSCFVSR